MTDPLKRLIEELDTAQLWEEEKKLKRGDFLNPKGSIDKNLYFVLEGSLRVYTTDEEVEHNIRFAYPGSLIGALDSYIMDRPSQFYIQAIKACRIRCLSKDSFEGFMRKDKARMDLWHNLLELLVFQQLEREVDLLTSSPKERYRRVLERSPQLFQEIPNKHIASYLRMSPETLSRLKKS